MRRAGRWVTVWAWAAMLACSGGPSPAGVERDAEPLTVDPVEPDPEPSTRADDPLLARARGQMRRGRVPDDVREQLLASRDPDHRHAARLLQAVAGEAPARVLSRAAGGSEVLVADPSEVDPPDVEPPRPAPSEPEPPEPPEPAKPVVAPVEEDRSDDARLDPPPKWDDIPPESPLRTWLAGANEAEPPPPPVAIDLPIERLLGPELLLLRERPPRAPSSNGLIILTSMSLSPGDDAGEVWLELAGSGPANVHVQPLDHSRVRLTIPDAGAVPSFLAARPQGRGLTILDVARREHDVELELALAPGWRFVTLAQLGNGATVGFSRVEIGSP